MIVLLAAALAVAGIVTGFALDGVQEASVRLGIRTTARIGAVWLCVAFATSGLNSLLRASWTRWLLRNRRLLGLGFATIHTAHAVMVLWLGLAYTESFWRTTAMSSVIGGSVGYVALYAMTITSFGGPTKAIGRRAWKVLHKSGIYMLWAIFLVSYLPMASSANPIPLALVVVLLVAYAIRLAAFARGKAKRRTRA